MTGSVVTVGTFDGVHRGHHAVLAEIHRRAVSSGRRSMLVTFEPHPLEVVNPDAAPALLTTTTERLAALATSGIDRVMTLRFDRAMAALDPADFVDQVLLPRCDLRELVIGHDHGFGRGRQVFSAIGWISLFSEAWYDEAGALPSPADSGRHQTRHR